MFDLDIQKKLEVLEPADRLKNVAEASRLSGVSGDTIYRHRRLIKEGGVQALKRKWSQKSMAKREHADVRIEIA